MNLKKNILPLGKLNELKVQLGQKRIALVGGCFDIFHYGHLHFLREAKREGDVLVVLLESDEFIRLRKRKEPFHTQNQRAEILAELKVVDYIVLLPFLKNPDKEYGEIVEVLKPTIIPITKGDIHHDKKMLLAKRVGARLIEINQLESFSSSQITTYASILRD